VLYDPSELEVLRSRISAGVTYADIVATLVVDEQ